MADGDDGNVTFSVKELLERIDHKLENLDTKLENKAERVELLAVIDKVNKLEIAAIKNATIEQVEAQAVSNRRRSIWALATAAVAILGIVVNVIFNLVGK